MDEIPKFKESPVLIRHISELPQEDQDRLNNYKLPIVLAEVVEISEIERVIKVLKCAANSCIENNNRNRASAYNAAIRLLKGILPK